MTVVERRKAVLKLKLCFQCLFPGHYKRFCKKSKCKVESCERRHHKLLHLPKQKDQETNTSQEKFNIRETTKRDANVQTNAANVLPQVKRGATALPVVAVKVHEADGLETTTYALLDQASEASFIHTNLAKELHLEGPKGILSVKSLTGTTSIEAQKVDVILESADPATDGTRLLARAVIVTDRLDVQLKVAPIKDDVEPWEHLSDIDFPRVELDDILILIGADNPEIFITEQVRTGGVEKPWGFKYKLGWALMGPTNKLRTSQVDVNLLQHSNAAMDEMVFKDEVKQFSTTTVLVSLPVLKELSPMKIRRRKK